MSECKRLYDKAISLSPDFADAMGGYGESRPLPRFPLSIRVFSTFGSIDGAREIKFLPEHSQVHDLKYTHNLEVLCF